MDLEPERGLGAAAAQEDPLDLEAMGRGVFEDVPRAAGGRFVDGAEDVAGTVGQRQAGDRAPGLRVLVRRSVPLPVVADDQSLRAWRHGRGLLVEHLEDVDASLLGLALLVAGEVAAIPVEDRAGGGLAGLEGVEPLDGRVGIAAGGPRAEDSLARLGEVAGARADDHGHVAVLRRPQAEHPQVGVDPSLGDGNARAQAQVAGRSFAQSVPRPCPAGRSASATSRAGLPARPPSSSPTGQPPSGRA